MNTISQNKYQQNSERKTFSKTFKRQALIRYSLGYTLDEIFGEITKTNDKKYYSKLLYKWRHEMYKKREILFFGYLGIDKYIIENEIENLYYENEIDDIETEFKNI